jgi:glycosyltransferase involved in cell wall biosynthesis
MNRRRILFIDHTAALGGGEIALLNLLRSFDRTRYEPIVLLFADGPFAGRLKDIGIETHLLPAESTLLNTRKDSLGGGTLLRLRDSVSMLRMIRSVARFIRDHEIDLVHTNSLKSDLIGGLAARLAGVPVVWHVRDRIADDYLPAKVVRLFRVLCRLIPNHIVVISKAVGQTLDMNADEKRVSLVYDGTILDAGPVSTGAIQSGRLIGLVGRISPWKGQDIFINAAAIVRGRFPDARFQIIGAPMFGEEEFERGLHALVEKLQLNGSIEFTGFRTDVPELMSKLDVLVHASTTGEPFGQVVIEGMALGKPVVATRGGGVPEIVDHPRTGFLVPMGNAPEMAAAIMALLEDPVRSAEMGRAGRDRVARFFNVDRTAAEVQALYDRIL